MYEYLFTTVFFVPYKRVQDLVSVRPPKDLTFFPNY